ncbi:MAG: 3-isopropylmalate dehydrogenase [Acidobacteria bacterium]|nr:MAG: 3-isopropylmalate dehydrogenase [Acidobacteriota bacterium]
MPPARIAVLPGDGIGPEVIDAAVGVLREAASREGVPLEVEWAPIGGAALKTSGEPLPESTLAACLGADAVLLGAVGDPAFDAEPPPRRPEAGLLKLRRAMGVFANVRPARVLPGLEGAGPLKPEVARGLDLVIVRELTGGLYFGQPRSLDLAGGSAVNTLVYTRAEVERVAEVAFRLAEGRRRRVTSVDKANVLETSVLWRTVVEEVGRRHPSVELSHQYVDSAAMALALSPASFDVVLTENLFGDVLSDEAGALVGSLGLLPSASLGRGPGLFEPVHGSAPALAGKDAANPIGAILSAAMLLRDGLGLPRAAERIEAAVEAVLSSGPRTADLLPPGAVAGRTSDVARAVREAVAARRNGRARRPRGEEAEPLRGAA